MAPAYCFLLALEVIKWLSKMHQSSEKCIYFQTRLFVPSLKVGFSIDTMPQDLPNSHYVFVAVSALNTQGRSWAQLNMSRSDSINNRMVVSCCVVFIQDEISTILVSVKSTGSWLHAGTCPVFVR